MFIVTETLVIRTVKLDPHIFSKVMAQNCDVERLEHMLELFAGALMSQEV